MQKNRKRRMVGWEVRLTGYLAATAGVGWASQAEAAVVSDMTVHPFGINGAVGIDFNSDTQVDFEIDHDRIDLGSGNVVDYLQIDKNDTNGSSVGENPCPISVFDTFETNGTIANNTALSAYVHNGAEGSYPAALGLGELIGPGSTFDFEETDNFQGSGQTIRANRLIDEDNGQVSEIICGLSEAHTYEVPDPANLPCG